MKINPEKITQRRRQLQGDVFSMEAEKRGGACRGLAGRSPIEICARNIRMVI